MHQTDDASRTAHIALHVLHVGGTLDGNATGIEADALADEGDRLIAALAAVPPQDHGAAGPGRALRHAKQRTHSKLRHRLDVKDLDNDAELAQLGRAARELDREKHVRRLVDEFARHNDAVDGMGVRRKRLSRRGRIINRDRNVGTQRAFLAVFLPRLVTIEFIGTKPHADRDRGRGFRLHGTVRQFGDNGQRIVARTQLAGGCAAEFEEILLFEIGEFADTDYNQALNLDSFRRQDFERRAALSLELTGCGRPFDEIVRSPQRLAGGGAELERIVAEHDQNAAGRGRKRDEADLDGVGHR